jgi:hypothetical protein
MDVNSSILIFSTDGVRGFRSADKEIKIFDRLGKPFYFFTKPDIQPAVKFNLPKGKYFTSNTLVEVNPVKYDLPKLPKRERTGKEPELYETIIMDNPNKCSINYDKKLIIIDPEICKLPTFVLYYILQHEIGHFYYTTEKYADLYAAYQMLSSGFNPSQVQQANNLTLSDRNVNRKIFAVETAKKASK